MLSIKSAQIDQLEHELMRDALQQLKVHIKNNQILPYSEWGSEKIDKFLSNLITKSRQFGFIENRDIETFIMLFLNTGNTNLNELPQWITDTITYPGRSAKQKIEILIQQLHFGSNV